MHEDDGLAGPSDDGEHFRIERAGGDVVDDVCAGGEGFLGHACAVGVDADGDVGGFRDGGADVFDGGDDAAEFFIDADGCGAWAGAFAADVNDCCAGGDEVADRGR